ncbi:MAG: Uma2 family endonuclease [Phycisphaeraceae bacterium]
MSAIPSQHGRRPSSKLPPLEAGDRLTATEFLRYCDDETAPKRAELINGVVRIMSPINYAFHSNPHANLLGWLSFYTALTPGVAVGAPSSMRLDEDNVPEPDALLRIPESAGGQSRVTKAGYLEGPPEFVAEVANSTVSFDLHDKLDVYRRHGVREYLVWRVRDDAIDWFSLREGRYEKLPLSDDGFYKSEVFPGLWLDEAALRRGDLPAVSQGVKRGTESTPEHAGFVHRLKSR